MGRHTGIRMRASGAERSERLYSCISTESDVYPPDTIFSMPKCCQNIFDCVEMVGFKPRKFAKPRRRPQVLTFETSNLNVWHQQYAARKVLLPVIC
jgi:hypothetical protein